MHHKLLFQMILGFFIFIVVTVGSVYFMSNTPVPDNDSIHDSLSSSTDTVIEKVLPTLPPPTPEPTPSSVTPSVLGAIDQKNKTDNGLNIDKQSLYSLINAHRKENNLPELRVHNALELSSNKKLKEMNAEKYWQHENREGKTSWYLFEQSGYHYAKAGENLSFGNNSAWSVFDAWKNSPNHNTQMLSTEYENMGLTSDCATYEEAGKISCVVVLHLGKQL